MPNNLDVVWMTQFHEVIIPKLPDQIRNPLEEASRKGWSFYAVNQRRGRCSYKDKEITIPIFAFNEIKKGQHRFGYLEWYISHELAHAWDFMSGSYIHSSPHGDSFMKHLERICPREFLVYEINYKPRNVKSSGFILMEI